MVLKNLAAAIETRRVAMAHLSVSRNKGVEKMKSFHQTIYVALTAALLFGAPLTTIVHAADADVISNIGDIRSRGQSVPPFINPGVNANLLLLIDNSGSMIDMAYTDVDLDGDGKEDTASYCSDATYDTGLPYTGYFEQASWYQWDDEGVNYWDPVDPTADPYPYNSGVLVYDNGITYKCASSSCTGVPGEDEDWVPLTSKDGTLEDVPDGFTFYKGKLFKGSQSIEGNLSTGAEPVAEGSFVVENNSGCIATTGTAYSNNDVCLILDETSTPNKVLKFAASGKFLNWLSASKFDIEKKVLTGGKYNAEADLLISENRGCAGSGFLKEIEVSNTTLGKRVLSLSVRGPVSGNPLEYENDKITSDDYTTRIEILGLTTPTDKQPSTLPEACQQAIDAIMSPPNPEKPTNLDGISQLINSCLTPAREAENEELTDQRPLLNQALQFCQKLINDGLRDLNTIILGCEKLYMSTSSSPTAYLPSEINPYYGGYMCYGIYDDDLEHTSRAGYIGRCWNPGLGVTTPCDPKPATNGCSLAASATSCEYTVDNTHYRNHRNTVDDPAYNWICTEPQTKAGISCKKDGWTLLYTDGTSTYNEPTCGVTITSTSEVKWVPPDFDRKPASDDQNHCILQGAIDYCNSMMVPEVIDPSDQASTTTNFWNLPATLIDSGIIVAFGTDRPLAVMKGHIQQKINPTGVLQTYAKDLRIGAMKINAVGSLSECDPSSTGNIEDFCYIDEDPNDEEKNANVNKDGAKLIASLRLGRSVYEKDETLTHIEGVAEAINDVQADTWTPLAEAVFSAIGYYTQRVDMRLHDDDFDILEADDPERPVQYSCQDNHLLIVTEGASTKDINDSVKKFVEDLPADTTEEETGTCPGGLQGSTYLDDLTGFAYYDKEDPDAEVAAKALYGTDAYIEGEVKEGITTHIITSGSLRDEGDGECNPVELMTNAAIQGGSVDGYINGEDPKTFNDSLISTIESIIARASSGSAASVISSSRSGEGAVYQALFWPESKSADGEHIVSWFGDVHSLFIDSQGHFYEDTNSNGKLDLQKNIDIDGDEKCDTVNEDTNNNGILDQTEDLKEDIDEDGNLDVKEICSPDQLIVTYYDEDKGRTLGCNDFDYITKTCKIAPKELDEIRYIWSADQWLSEIDDPDDPENSNLLQNREYTSNDKKRYIFTWNDLNNDGIVNADYNDGTIDDMEGEIIPFHEATNWENFKVTADRGSVTKDFGMADDTVVGNVDANLDEIVNWIRGQNIEGFRNREDEDGNFKLLGDVINSTPMVVSTPQEGFHLLYNDSSYVEFVYKYKDRRHVVYVGANDGMLHAFNAGFYDKEKKGFCRSQTCNGTDEDKDYELGAELWAYVPYNLQPHLEFLTRPDYVHKYYVDLRPRIFDVQIFNEESACSGDKSAVGCIHPNGWGTILVGGMRLGGAPVHARELNGLKADNRVFSSAYFVLDITDPETPPKLLGEITRTSKDVNFDGIPSVAEAEANATEVEGTDLGYSTAIPTMVIMKKKDGIVGSENNQWYLTLGSGPHADFTVDDPAGDRALKGFSDQKAKVAVVPLYNVVSSEPKISMRVPNVVPGPTGGRFELDESTYGFVSDLITVDFDINPSSADYLADAVYFGTVEATETEDDENFGFTFAADGSSVWNGGGKLYRLVTRKSLAATDNDSYFVPRNRANDVNYTLYKEGITTPEDWTITTLMDPGRPITGAPSVAFDGNNYWVYFGTGRFFDAADKTDDTQHAYYGIKEPLVAVPTILEDLKKFTWETIELTGSNTLTPGAKGLLKVDQIQVREAGSGSASELSCVGGGTACLPSGILKFDQLEKYIAGTGICSTPFEDNCVDGWYKEFTPVKNRERNLGQAAIIGGLVTFTTYQPYESECNAEGDSYLYGVYYKTGTAWYENLFGAAGIDSLLNVKDKLELGRGLSLTPNLHVGDSEKGEVTAIVQTSTGEMIQISATPPIKTYESGLQGWKEAQCP